MKIEDLLLTDQEYEAVCKKATALKAARMALEWVRDNLFMEGHQLDILESKLAELEDEG